MKLRTLIAAVLLSVALVLAAQEPFGTGRVMLKEFNLSQMPEIQTALTDVLQISSGQVNNPVYTVFLLKEPFGYRIQIGISNRTALYASDYMGYCTLKGKEFVFAVPSGCDTVSGLTFTGRSKEVQIEPFPVPDSNTNWAYLIKGNEVYKVLNDFWEWQQPGYVYVIERKL